MVRKRHIPTDSLCSKCSMTASCELKAACIFVATSSSTVSPTVKLFVESSPWPGTSYAVFQRHGEKDVRNEDSMAKWLLRRRVHFSHAHDQPRVSLRSRATSYDGLYDHVVYIGLAECGGTLLLQVLHQKVSALVLRNVLEKWP